MQPIVELIRTIPDFPEPGIQFKDITPLLKRPDALLEATEAMVEPFGGQGVTVVGGIEARGFIFGSMAAQLLGAAFVPLRKAGKLPHEVETVSYQLEYGEAQLEVHKDAFSGTDRVLLVDDLLATGGTALASCELTEKIGGVVVGCTFLIEIEGLGGRQRLADYPLHAVVSY